jgi:hypothetical protein
VSPRHGIAAITGCRECWSAAGIHGGQEYEPGRFLTIVHASHIGQLEAAGWKAVHLYDDDDVPDVLCRHLAAEASDGQRVD